MNNRYLYRAKRTDNGERITWNIFTGIPHGVSILEDTVCACTELKDKNGKLIWENDIVRDKRMKCRVIWDEEEGSWMLQTVSGAMYGIGSINSEKYVVVGNFFDEGSENIGKGAEEN